MKMIRHIIETLGLIAIITIMALIPTDRYQNLSLLICGISCIGILIFLAIYLFKYHKKELFIFLILLLGLSHNTTAGLFFRDDGVTDQMVESYKSKIRQNGPKICTAEDDFDIDGDIPVPMNLLADACEINTMYDKLGMGDLDAWRDWTVFTGASLDDYNECAKDLIEANADWYQKNEEDNLLPVPELMKQDKGKCWPCGIVDIFLESIEKISFKLSDYMVNLALFLLGIMTLFWLLFRILIFIGEMSMGGQSELMSDILKRLFVVLCTAIILKFPLSDFMRITIDPLIRISTAISTEISAVKLTNDQSFTDKLHLSQAVACSCCDNPASTCDDLGSAEKYGKTQKSTERLISEENRSAILCSVCRIYKQTLPFSTSGQALMRYSFKNKKTATELISKITGGATDYIPSPLPMYLLGATLVIVFTLLAFFAVFKLIDIFIRLGFIFILLPLLIAAYAFPISREYTKSGWEFFIHAMLSLIALAISMSLLVLLFTSFLPGDAQNMLIPAILGN